MRIWTEELTHAIDHRKEVGEEWGVKFVDSPHGPFSFDHSALGETYKNELERTFRAYHFKNAR